MRTLSLKNTGLRFFGPNGANWSSILKNFGVISENLIFESIEISSERSERFLKPRFSATDSKFLSNSLKLFLGTVYGTIPLSIRFGSNYTLHSKIIKEFEGSSDQFKLDYMYNKTLETLMFAEQNIPYYKNKFFEYGEYCCIEIDTEALQAKVIPNSKV